MAHQVAIAEFLDLEVLMVELEVFQVCLSSPRSSQLFNNNSRACSHNSQECSVAESNLKTPNLIKKYNPQSFCRQFPSPPLSLSPRQCLWICPVLSMSCP